MKKRKSLTIIAATILMAACLSSCGTGRSWGSKKPRYGGCQISAIQLPASETLASHFA